MTLIEVLEQLKALPSAFPVKPDAEVQVALFDSQPDFKPLPIAGVTYDVPTNKVVLLAFDCYQPLRSKTMAAPADNLKAALDATPVDQAVDTFFAWLEDQAKAKITNSLLATFAVEGLRVANQIVDMVLARYGV